MTSRVLTFDIEVTNLKADMGFMVCVCYKWLDDPRVYTLSILDNKEAFAKDPTNDRHVVRAMHDVMAQADMYVTFFGKRFDLPYLQSKFMAYGLAPLPNIAHEDVFFTVKSNMTLTRKSLQNTSEYLGLASEKTPLDKKTWIRAAAGHVPSVKYVERHCQADIRVTEELYLKVRPYSRMHARVEGSLKCRYCGSPRLQSRGLYISTLQGQQYRIQCQACKGWDRRTSANWSRLLVLNAEARPS